MPADDLTFLIGFAAVFGALGWYLWHLEREVARLGMRLDDAAGSRVAGDALAGDGTGAAGAGGRRAAREESHIERDAGSLPHAPTPASPRHEAERSPPASGTGDIITRGDDGARAKQSEGHAGREAAVEDGATTAKRERAEDGP